MGLKLLYVLFDVSIGEDNLACTVNVERDGLLELFKYIDLKQKSVVDYVQQKRIWIEFILLEAMEANAMIKNLFVQQSRPIWDSLEME